MLLFCCPIMLLGSDASRLSPSSGRGLSVFGRREAKRSSEVMHEVTLVVVPCHCHYLFNNIFVGPRHYIGELTGSIRC
jgi:hypothetical protein